MTYEVNDRGKFCSRRTQPLGWLPEAIRLKTFEVHLPESSETYMRRKHEPRGVVRYLKEKTYEQPNYRPYRSLRTLQGLDYVHCLRGLDSIKFFDHDKWIKLQQKRPVRDATFLLDVSNTVRKPKTERDREIASFQSLEHNVPDFGPNSPRFVPTTGEFRLIRDFITAPAPRQTPDPLAHSDAEGQNQSPGLTESGESESEELESGSDDGSDSDRDGDGGGIGVERQQMQTGTEMSVFHNGAQAGEQTRRNGHVSSPSSPEEETGGSINSGTAITSGSPAESEVVDLTGDDDSLVDREETPRAVLRETTPRALAFRRPRRSPQNPEGSIFVDDWDPTNTTPSVKSESVTSQSRSVDNGAVATEIIEGYPRSPTGLFASPTPYNQLNETSSRSVTSSTRSSSSRDREWDSMPNLIDLTGDGEDDIDGDGDCQMAD